jgi:hypothetical protein
MFVAEEIGNFLIVVVEITVKPKQDFVKSRRWRLLSEN